MAMVINHNIPALTTYNTVNRTNAALEKSIQKLSTGLRINSAADDAAGLAISEKMRSQINGMDRAVSNAQDGISMIQTAEGALNETHSILQRMRELSVQAANDTLTSQDRGYIQLEIDQLRDEVTRIGNTTQFNKKKLLNGDAAVLWSSSDLSTKAVVNGGLRSIDQFGQKVVTEGNYNINIKAEAGQGEVQKSDIFKIKHKNVLMDKSINTSAGVTDVAGDNLPAGEYAVKSSATTAVSNLTGAYGFPAKYSVAKWESTFETATPTNTGLVAADNKTFQFKVNGSNFGDEIILTTGETAAQATAKIQAALKNAKADGFSFRVWTDSTSGKLNIETLTSTEKAAKIELVAGSGTGTDAVAKIGPAASTDTADQEFKLADALTITPDATKLDGNANVLFEVESVDANNKTVTLKATANILDENGNNTTKTQTILLTEGTAEKPAFLGKDALELTLADGKAALFEKGDKFVYNFSKAASANAIGVEVSATANSDWPESWGSITDTAVRYGLNADNVAGKDIHLKNFYLNTKTGEATVGDIILSTDKETFNATNVGTDKTLSTFEAAYIGQVAKGDVKLRDLDKFWDSQGVFMLDDPQTITITQGDGTQANVTLYANDTLSDVESKLNNAIASGLGQGQYVDDSSKFVTFVEQNGGNSESVRGTFLIRSVVPGASGQLSLSGNEDIINAFSLNTIQEAKESKYTVEVKDAHTDAIIASGVRISGNKLMGVVNPNVDVTFDSMSGIKATWNDTKKAFDYTNSPTGTNTTLHLSDNTTVFQIGANEGEDMGVHIGDMRANALGIDRVNVTSRETASRSITILDNAIDKVSMQRAKLGAYQNRLEHTINNLNTASENITAAESRIRDTDMAKEMMNFTKLQIMLQAGTSMLAQANQLPQNVMALVR